MKKKAKTADVFAKTQEDLCHFFTNKSESAGWSWMTEPTKKMTAELSEVSWLQLEVKSAPCCLKSQWFLPLAQIIWISEVIQKVQEK